MKNQNLDGKCESSVLNIVPPHLVTYESCIVYIVTPNKSKRNELRRGKWNVKGIEKHEPKHKQDIGNKKLKLKEIKEGSGNICETIIVQKVEARNTLRPARKKYDTIFDERYVLLRNFI